MLEIRRIEVYYGNSACLHGITLKVKNGQTVSVIGSNGAGKSTLMKTIIGLLFCSYGEIEYNGKRIENKDPSKLVDMGIALGT